VLPMLLATFGSVLQQLSSRRDIEVSTGASINRHHVSIERLMCRCFRSVSRKTSCSSVVSKLLIEYVSEAKEVDMSFYLQLSTCMHSHGNNSPARFDPIRSDSNYPTLFCSFQCERQWIEECLSNLSLADVFEIQALASNVTATGNFAAISGQ
jgi:hypothetical protein